MLFLELIVPDSVLDEVTGMAVNTVRYYDRLNCNPVAFPYLFSNLDTELYGMNVLTANVSESVIRTRAMPNIGSFDYVIIPVSGLGVNMVMIIRYSDQIAFECNLFSLFFSLVNFCHITFYVYLIGNQLY